MSLLRVLSALLAPPETRPRPARQIDLEVRRIEAERRRGEA